MIVLRIIEFFIAFMAACFMLVNLINLIQRWRQYKKWILVFLLCLVPSLSNAATCYVRDGGTATGTQGISTNGGSWSQAYDQLSTAETNCARGDTIYVADGNYTEVSFDTAVSGTTVIIIRKATVANHGTSTGWLDSYGDGQAAFTCTTGCFDFATGYWEIYGVVGAGFASTPYGITVHNTTVAGSVTIQVGNVTHILLDHIEAWNTNDFTGQEGNLTNVIYAASGGTDFTVQYSYLHSHNGSATILLNDWTTLLFQYNYTDDGYQKELVSARRDTNFTWKFNVSRNASGTAPWAFESPNGVYFYGNVFYVTDSRFTNTDGLIIVPSGWSTDSANVNVFNNTWVVPYLGFSNDFGNWPNCGTCRAANNLFYNVNGLGVGSGWTFRDYSWCGGSYSCAAITGESNDQAGGTSDPFVDSANGNFHLTANTTAGYTGITSAWANGASDYNQDMDGNTRTTWTRGAYEFDAGGGAGNSIILFLEWIPFIFGVFWHFRNPILSGCLTVVLSSMAGFSLATMKTKEIGYHATLKTVTIINERLKKL